MNVETISMDPRIANIHFKDYRKKVREHKAKRELAARAQITEGNKQRVAAYKQISLIEKEDVIAMESYRAMAKGARIINVASALRGAGLAEDTKLPILAIARASWSACHLHFNATHLMFGVNKWTSWSYARNQPKPANSAVEFKRDFFGAELTNFEWRKNNNFPSMQNGVKAQVPTIPAHLRPEGDLDSYHILFEAKWEKTAPPDPILLRHIAGQMYSVLAQWDLTATEKAVLEGRFA